jgi:hypothetical protein
MCKERMFQIYSFEISEHNANAYGKYSASNVDDKAFKIIIMELKGYDYLGEVGIA